MIYWAFNRYSAIQLQEYINHPERYFSSEELNQYHKFVVPKRKLEWLASRILVKRLVMKCVDSGLQPLHRSISIRKMSSGVPYVELEGIGKLGWLSLSHSNEGVFAAFSLHTGHPFGVDLELIEERSPQFVSDYFTEPESRWVNTYREEEKNSLVNLIWSVKEAYLKALGKGLQLDTRSIVITGIDLTQAGVEWSSLQFQANIPGAQNWRLLFRRSENFILTMCVPADAQIECMKIDLGQEKAMPQSSNAWEYTA